MRCFELPDKKSLNVRIRKILYTKNIKHEAVKVQRQSTSLESAGDKQSA